MRLLASPAKVQNSLDTLRGASLKPHLIRMVGAVNPRRYLRKIMPMFAQNSVIKPINMSQGLFPFRRIGDVIAKGRAKSTFLFLQC
jgi:hypothetical protein